MFDIGFIPDEPAHRDDGWIGLWGRTVIGEFSERFIAPLGRWQRRDYERQWIDGAQRLLDGARESAFVVEAGRLWWTAWREGEEVIFQQRLLVDEAMAKAWTADAAHLPYELVGSRTARSNDGAAVSEWRVSVDDVRAFVRRRAGSRSE